VSICGFIFQQECGLYIDDRNVSKSHAQVIRVENEFIIRDQGSVNGTYVGEHRITHHTLRDGDIIRIGGHQILFRLTGGHSPQGGVPAVTEAGADAGAGGVAVADAQTYAGPEWIQEKIAEIGDLDQARRKRASWLLNIAIGCGIVLTMLLLLYISAQSGDVRNYGAVELETGYAQLIPVPAPYYGRGVHMYVVGEEIVEITEQDRRDLKELRGIDPRFYFIQVRAAGEGTTRIKIETPQREYYVTVLAEKGRRPEKRYAEEYGRAESGGVSEEVKAAKAREWARSARIYLRERPFEALEMLNVARAYAERAGLDMDVELENLEVKARKQIEMQWKGLCLRYSQSGKRGDLAARQSVLEAMMRLVPDKRDPRHQWAQLRLDGAKAAAGRRGRRTGPWGR
jgi:hypothetical protein